MLNHIIESELVDLSNDQQELLAGGGYDGNYAFEQAKSNFKQKTLVLQGFATSGRDGSTAQSFGILDKIDTSASDTLKLGY